MYNNFENLYRNKKEKKMNITDIIENILKTKITGNKYKKNTNL